MTMATTQTILPQHRTSARFPRLGRATIAGLALIAFASVAGCDDPAKDKTKVTATEAKPTTQASGAAPTAAAVRYAFDQKDSKIAWTASKVTGKHDGGFKTFNGHVSTVGQDPTAGSVVVDIDATSLYSDSEKLDGHLKSADFFDVAKFPKAGFVSTAVKPGGDKGATHTVTGNFTLHGVTKSITFPATIKTSAEGVDADAEFAINRKDFGLVYAGKPDDLIRDEVVIKLTIRAHGKT